jgi:hypothetical protein
LPEPNLNDRSQPIFPSKSAYFQTPWIKTRTATTD